MIAGPGGWYLRNWQASGVCGAASAILAIASAGGSVRCRLPLWHFAGKSGYLSWGKVIDFVRNPAELWPPLDT